MKTIKLLLVEDNFDLAYMVKDGMEDIIGGYEVDLATNGKEGLEHFKTFAPDIIVSDIEMPVMNGYEMVKIIRQSNRDVPVIFATGKVNAKDVTGGYEVGADNYIKKPYTAEELNAHIIALINLKKDSKLRLKNTIHTIGKYTFDPKNFTLIYNDSEKKVLTSRESQILGMLLEHKSEVVKKDSFLDSFWENQDPVFASRSLDVFITKLRGYLSKDTSISIKNVKSVGYILDF
jgi:DNA-binding response OmpR family regulator